MKYSLIYMLLTGIPLAIFAAEELPSQSGRALSPAMYRALDPSLHPTVERFHAEVHAAMAGKEYSAQAMQEQIKAYAYAKNVQHKTGILCMAGGVYVGKFYNPGPAALMVCFGLGCIAEAGSDCIGDTIAPCCRRLAIKYSASRVAEDTAAGRPKAE